jgi:hypothetical protein
MPEILINSLSLLAMLLGPAIVAAALIHGFEHNVQHQMAARWGWRSVLWTGWLGTPIHELSHVLMCRLFGHRIEEVRFFDPDNQSGRLGYVKHSYHRGHWFEELGNVFIGTAPFIGGSLVMLVLLWLFYPSLARGLLRSEDVLAAESWQTLLSGTALAYREFLQSLFAWESLTTFRLWIFLYLTLCVASHMAPSASDYKGAMRGLVIMAFVVLAAAVIAMTLTSDPIALSLSIIKTFSPVMIMGGLSVVLCFVLWLVVSAICLAIPPRR